MPNLILKDKKVILNYGFTLVEMSIVILIIGLLISAITIGANLNSTATARSIISQYNNILSATKNFQINYQSYPGDIPNGLFFFPNCNDQGVSNCAGDGDNLIESTCSVCAPNYPNEAIAAFRQMSLAKMLNGNYLNVYGATQDFTGGINVPAVKGINNSIFIYTTNAASFSVNQGGASNDGKINALALYSITTGFTSNLGYYALTPQQAFIIDSKIDDGLPSTGDISGGSAVPGTLGSGCATNTVIPPVASNYYNISSNQATCALYFYF
jgi:prepilin-type N-terminal cleavage/methylation domain-containing protein